MLYNIFKKEILFLHPKTWKNCPYNWPKLFFFQNCQSVKNQPKSHFLFQKNVSLPAFYIMTVCNLSKQFNFRWNNTMQCQEIFIRVEEDFSTPMYVYEWKKKSYSWFGRWEPAAVLKLKVSILPVTPVWYCRQPDVGLKKRVEIFLNKFLIFCFGFLGSRTYWKAEN